MLGVSDGSMDVVFEDEKKIEIGNKIIKKK